MGGLKKYTREFKVEAVRLLETSGKNGHEIEKDRGIGSGQIYRWRKQLDAEAAGIRAFPGTGNPRLTEKLRREGTSAGHNRVARLMREHGLQARTPRPTCRDAALRSMRRK